MAEEIEHECPKCGHMNYKILPELEAYAGTSAEVDNPGDGFRRLPVGCQRHGCDQLYHIYVKP